MVYFYCGQKKTVPPFSEGERFLRFLFCAVKDQFFKAGHIDFCTQSAVGGLSVRVKEVIQYLAVGKGAFDLYVGKDLVFFLHHIGVQGNRNGGGVGHWDASAARHLL